MPVLGHINLEKFLMNTKGRITGVVITDAKQRAYLADYSFKKGDDGYLSIQKANGSGDVVRLPAIIPLNNALVAFFGLYSGDGAKGSEDPTNQGIIKPTISFSQKEPHLVAFAVDQFKKLFGVQVRFVFSLGEDSVYFMAGPGLEMLKKYYGGKIPDTPPLVKVRSELNDADKRYLAERRPVPGKNEDYLAYYYFHKAAMEKILQQVKKDDLLKAGIPIDGTSRVEASLRRPFKKGARELGGSSRSDEIHVGGVNGIAELFIKILHEIEDSNLRNAKESTQALIEWVDIPSETGEVLDLLKFFSDHPFSKIGNSKAVVTKKGPILEGKWGVGKVLELYSNVRISPLWSYVSGLYLAEGSTPKEKFFSMYYEHPQGLAFGFTSSEGFSLELVLKCLKTVFMGHDCLYSWKVKVGSQYFSELVMIGLKHGVAMQRGGLSGDGKVRTMEISLAIKPWALSVAPCLEEYESKYSHVEPTGGGVPRIDFSASSAICKWAFALMMYTVFGDSVKDPSKEFR